MWRSQVPAGIAPVTVMVGGEGTMREGYCLGMHWVEK